MPLDETSVAGQSPHMNSIFRESRDLLVINSFNSASFRESFSMKIYLLNSRSKAMALKAEPSIIVFASSIPSNNSPPSSIGNVPEPANASMYIVLNFVLKEL